jgi:uncharacterized Zn-binding protein involved in type VI secretion
MFKVIKAGDMSIGHCWPASIAIPNLALNFNVFVEGLPPILVGDDYSMHPGPCGNLPPHAPKAVIGSPSVFVGGIPILRHGDILSCGDTAYSQNCTVFVA